MATTVLVKPPSLKPTKPLLAPKIVEKAQRDPWPQDILEAYRRYRGPYTVVTAEAILEEEAVELFNGWLVRQEMTHYIERRVVANIQENFSLFARKINFGQAIPDQAECLLNNGDVFKPDASLIAWDRLENDLILTGPNQRPLLNGGPELVVEVRSPSNWRAQERRKRALYFANKVKIVWDVDVEQQVIWVYRAESADQATRYSINDLITCEPFLPGWQRRVSDFFAPQASAESVAGEVAQLWIAEGKQEGFVEGKQEGFSEGKQEGVDEGMTKVLCELLPLLARTHFALALPSDLSNHFAKCNLTQLQTLQATLYKYSSWHEWLAQLPSLSG